MKNEFEDIFGSLKDAEVKAPQHLWGGIKKEVKFNNGLEALKNAKVSPNDTLWTKIKPDLLLYNFLTFSYNTFNIYYFGTALIIISAIFLFGGNEPTGDKPTKNRIAAVINKKNTFHNNKDVKNSPVKIEKQDKIEKPKKVRNRESVSLKNIDNVNENIKNAIVEDDTVSLDGNQVKIEKSGIVIPVDTFIVYDTIRYYDTIKVLQPHHFEKNAFEHGSIGFCSTGGFLWSSTTPSSGAFADLSNETKAAIKSKGTYSVMLEASLHLNKKVSLISGIGFSQCFEAFEYKQEKEEVDTSYGYKYFNVTRYVYNQHNYIKYDTVGQTYSLVLGADSAVDTIWRYEVDTLVFSIVDSMEVTVKDSNVVMIVDTNKYTYFYNFINRYSYVQIPLFLSYSFDISKRISLDLKAGVIANLLINAKGYGLSFDDTYEVVDVNNLPFLKLYFNYYGSAGISYHLDSRYSLCADVYYASSGNIFENGYYLKKKFYGAGIKLGFKYGF